MQSDKSNHESKKQTGRWSREEHERFMLGLMQYGKNWKKVEEIVATRSGSQVRSHAQKFFNKLQKSGHESKGKKQRRQEQGLQDNNDEEVSFNDNTDMLRSYDDDNSLATPMQIISLIKKQSIDNRKINLSNFKKVLQENEQKHINAKLQDQKNKDSFLQSSNQNPQLSQNAPQNEMLFSLNSFKSMNNIISAYEALNQTDPVNHFEDESFLIGLTKKYKKYFTKGGHFQNLIDFGNPHQVAKAAQLEKSLRKKSWTLAEGIEGDEHDLEDIKKKLKENQENKSNKNESNEELAQSNEEKKEQINHKSADSVLLTDPHTQNNQTQNNGLKKQEIIQSSEQKA